MSHPAATAGVLTGVVLLLNLAVKFTGSVAGTYVSVVLLVAPIAVAHVAARMFLGARPLGTAEPHADEPGASELHV